jgi:nucleotide-binding universal stress UspA family protein
MAMPPMLRWALARVPMRKAEKERLEREAMDARGFIAKLERLLLAIDESPNGQLAAQIAGLIAGFRAIPITLLPLDESPGNDQVDSDRRSAKESVVRAGAAHATKFFKEQRASAPSIDITVRTLEKPDAQAVAAEAKKGYGLLLAGIRNTRTKTGEFHREIARVVLSFDGPAALVLCHGDEPRPLPGFSNILVSVTGTEISRRAAELGMVIARACRCPMTALYVAKAAGSGVRLWRGNYALRQARAILNEVVEMGARYEVPINSRLRADSAAPEAILAQAKQTHFDLLIIGASRRPGDKLFLGDTAAMVLDRAPTSVLFLVG